MAAKVDKQNEGDPSTSPWQATSTPANLPGRLRPGLQGWLNNPAATQPLLHAWRRRRVEGGYGELHRGRCGVFGSCSAKVRARGVIGADARHRKAAVRPDGSRTPKPYVLQAFGQPKVASWPRLYAGAVLDDFRARLLCGLLPRAGRSPLITSGAWLKMAAPPVRMRPPACRYASGSRRDQKAAALLLHVAMGV